MIFYASYQMRAALLLLNADRRPLTKILGGKNRKQLIENMQDEVGV